MSSTSIHNLACIVFDPTSICILACDGCTESLIIFFFSMVPLNFFLVFLFYFVRDVVLDQDILFFLWHLPGDWLPSVIILLYQLLPSLFLKLETSNSASDFSQLLDQHLLGIGLGCTTLGSVLNSLGYSKFQLISFNSDINFSLLSFHRNRKSIGLMLEHIIETLNILWIFYRSVISEMYLSCASIIFT